MILKRRALQGLSKNNGKMHSTYVETKVKSIQNIFNRESIHSVLFRRMIGICFSHHNPLEFQNRTFNYMEVRHHANFRRQLQLSLTYNTTQTKNTGLQLELVPY